MGKSLPMITLLGLKIGLELITAIQQYGTLDHHFKGTNLDEDVVRLLETIFNLQKGFVQITAKHIS